MCGRTCLTLSPDEIRCSCSYRSNKNNKIKKPEWREEYNLGKTYLPSYNVAPTEVTPVLVSASHFDSNKNNDRVIVPMMWGIIPFWHKGDYKKHGLSTNNCRLENMLQSKLYKGSFQKGQRCVILCEGFYEWQTTKGAKSSAREAYYIYMPQKEKSIKIEDKATWDVENLNLLKIAGLFDIWTNENGDNLYSYTLITFESDKNFGWLHHRIPAILETEEQVSDWLDYDRVTDNQALNVLSPAKTIEWHRVSNTVNNTRNKSEICNKPLKEKSGIGTPSKNTLHSFFTVTKRSMNESDSTLDDKTESNPLKKIKYEDKE